MSTRIFAGSASSTTIWAINSGLTYADRLEEFQPGEPWIYSDFIGCAQIGQYGYYANEYGYDGVGPAVAKVDLSTLTYVSQVVPAPVGSSADSVTLREIAVSADGACLFVVGDDYGTANAGSLAVWKIRVSDMTVVDTLDLTNDWFSTGGNYATNGVCVADADYLYVATLDAASPYHYSLIQIDLSTFTVAASCDLEATDNLTQPMSGVLSGSYLYFGANDSANTTSSAVLVRFDPSTMTVDATLAVKTANTDSSDRVCSVVSDGTHLYAATAGGFSAQKKSILGKVDHATFSLVSTLDYATEEQPTPKEGLLIDGMLYLIPWQWYDTPSINPYMPVWKIDPATLTVSSSAALEMPHVNSSASNRPYMSQRLLHWTVGGRRRPLYLMAE